MFVLKQLALIAPALLLAAGAERSARADERVTQVAETARSLMTLGEFEGLAGAAADPTIVGRRSVTLDRQLLRALSDRTVITIGFDLLAGVSVIGEIAKLDEKGQGRFVASGPLANEPGSWFTIVVHGDIVVANIRSRQGSYQIRPTNTGGHELRKIDESLFPPCATGNHRIDPSVLVNSPAQKAAQGNVATAGTCGADDGSLVDMLVVYTVSAREEAGGTTAIEAVIALAEAETNQAYINSQVVPRLRVVATAEVDYTEAGKTSAQIINDLQLTDDGFLEEVHVLREVVKADIVSMLVNALSVTGRASPAIKPGNIPVPEWGFNIVHVNVAAGNYTFGHELGHNQGLRHNHESDPTDAAFPYSHGYVEPSGDFKTIMGVNTSSLPGAQTRIQYFSNPDLLFNGTPMGVPITEPTPSHCTLSINNTALNVANFRRSTDCNWNNICDDDEVADGSAADCNENGTPDDCELDCNGNGQPDDCDLTSGYSNDCNNNGKPDDCEADCNGNGLEDSCDIASGTSPDCNSNLVPDECEPGGLDDCNTNSVMDLCDIFNGTETDCDGNGVPDTCDISDGSGPDCNSNGILDDCDLLLPTGNDTNFNGVLDECEARACQLHKLFASDAVADDVFGSAVSIGGDVAVVGARANGAGEDSGSVYVSRWDPVSWRWAQEAKLVASDAEPGDRFGWSVAVDGDQIFVGAEYDDNIAGARAGSVYVFRWNNDTSTWVEEEKLIASDGEGSDFFGSSVSLDGETAIIGAVAANGVCAGGVSCNSGAAYVFRWNPSTSTWDEETKLIASDAAVNDFAGISVAIDADTAIIGAIGNDDACPNDPNCASGSAYVFGRDPSTLVWVEEAKLTASDAAYRDLLGRSVAVNGDLALVGADEDDHNAGANAGSVYFFRRSAGTSDWAQEARLTASDAAEGDKFGGAISLSGNTALVGASLDRHDGAAASGSAYVFRWDGASWTEETKLVAWDTDVNDMFGVSVSISSGRILIGAKGDDDAGDSAGSAYLYTLDGTDCDGDGSLDVCDLPGVASADCNGTVIADYCDILGGSSFDCNINGVPDECDIAAGTSLDCTANGVPDECDPDCNINGVADSCDLADMTSEDTGANGIPDECEPLVCQLDTFAAFDATADNTFDVSISTSGDVTVVGVRADNEAGTWAGAVYVYRWNSSVSAWNVEAKLTAPDAIDNGLFGRSVSVSGDLILVAAAKAIDNFSGMVYVFRWSPDTTEWTHETTILPPDPFVNFASSVSISRNVAIVGTSDTVGSAYIFRRDPGTTAWTQEARLYAPGISFFDLFGLSVSISNDVALVGAIFADDVSADDPGYNSGAAYVFRRNGPVWMYEATLTASDAVANHSFGASISIRDDVAIVGAPSDDDACPGNSNCESGAAYIFRRTGAGWFQEAKLTDSSPAASETFGISLAVGENVVAIGTPRDDEIGIDSGSVSVFRWNGTAWLEQQKVAAAETGQSDRLGASVSLSGNVVVSMNDPSSGASSAYVFAVGPVPYITPDCDADGIPDYCEVGDCNANGVIDDCDLAENTSSDCNSNGIPDECDIASGFSEDCTGDGIPDDCDPDCNGNSTPDSCDIDAGTSNDCNANGIPDDCDIANGEPDEDGNGIPDFCDAAGDPPPPPGQGDADNDRFISFTVPVEGAGRETALRVTLVTLYGPGSPLPVDPPDFSAREGEVRYVNLLRDEFDVPVTSCLSSPSFVTFYRCATVGCEPEYLDWAGLFGGETIHVSGSSIVPDSTYTVVQLAPSCNGNEAACMAVSESLQLATARHGDVDANGLVNVTDIVLTVDVVKDVLGAVWEHQCYVRKESPEPHNDSTNVTDIVLHVDAVKLLPYALDVPACP
jgi:FG-GAP repeat/Metallo-peptidase family M12